MGSLGELNYRNDICKLPSAASELWQKVNKC